MRFPRLVQSFTQSTLIDAKVDADGIDEDGAPIEGASWSGKCNWQDSTLETFDKNNSETKVNATLYIDGDPFPELVIISGGEVTAFGETRSIVQGMKARNPDATVNYTRLDLR